MTGEKGKDTEGIERFGLLALLVCILLTAILMMELFSGKVK